jgi:hypothetical protein
VQYKVPQHIDIEDKIVGPFTMKQFVYLLVAGFIIYGWWNFSNTFIDPPPMLIFLPLAIPVGTLGLSFALLKINDRPFEVFILSLLKFMFSPKQRIWREGYKAPEVIVKDPAAPIIKDDGKKDVRTLDELAKSLDNSQGEIEKKKSSIPAGPAATVKSEEVANINLSVKDVQGAAKKQAMAQKPGLEKNIPAEQKPAVPPAEQKKRGLLGIFKG